MLNRVINSYVHQSTSKLRKTASRQAGRTSVPPRSTISSPYTETITDVPRYRTSYSHWFDDFVQTLARLKLLPISQCDYYIIFHFFQILKINIPKNPEITHTSVHLKDGWVLALDDWVLVIGQHVDAIGQRWAGDRCCRDIYQSLTFTHQLMWLPFEMPCIPRSETMGICGIKFCTLHTFFCAFIYYFFFYIYLRLVSYITLFLLYIYIYIFFLNWHVKKCSPLTL